MIPDPGSLRARRLKAKYAFSGAGAEIDKTLPFGVGEEVLIKGRAVQSYGVGLSRLAAVRLTTQRLVVLSHYFFKADQAVEIPSRALLAVQRVHGGMTLTYRGPDSESTQVRLVASAGRRTRILDPLFSDPEKVIATFDRWLETNPPH